MQDDAAPPQPFIPPPDSPPKRRPVVIGLLVAGLVAVPILVLGLGIALFRAGGSEGPIVSAPEREVFMGGDDFDMGMDVQVVLESGPSITLPDSLLPGEDRGVNEATVQKVASVTSPSGSTELYTYEALLLDSAVGDTLDCLGVINDSRGSIGCRDNDEDSHIVMWGSEDRTSGTWYSVAVAGLPLDATTLVTETAAGRLVGSTIVNGVSYQEWPAAEGSSGGILPNEGRTFGEAMRTVALDANGIVVWSTTGGN